MLCSSGAKAEDRPLLIEMLARFGVTDAVNRAGHVPIAVTSARRPFRKPASGRCLHVTLGQPDSAAEPARRYVDPSPSDRASAPAPPFSQLGIVTSRPSTPRTRSQAAVTSASVIVPSASIPAARQNRSKLARTFVNASSTARSPATSRCDISRHGVALLCGISTPSLPVQGQSRPLQKFNRTQDIPTARSLTAFVAKPAAGVIAAAPLAINGSG
ncbi:hypothetical protein ABIB00_007758 [Bradyrhizobium sp. LB14.3]